MRPLLALAATATLTLAACGADDPEEEAASGNAGSAATDPGGATGSGGSDPGGATGSGGSGTTSGGTTSGGSGPVDGCVVDLECDPAPPEPTGDFAQDCVNRINQFRVECSCLPPLERWTEAEQCASANAEYDHGTGTPHSGWPRNACPDESGPLSRAMAGWATNECPRYSGESGVISGCLRSMYGEGADWAEELGRMPEQSDYDACSDDFPNCYVKYGHFIAMTKASHSLVACGIYDGPEDRDTWSVQNFK